jgi:hypothetical protein
MSSISFFFIIPSLMNSQYIWLLPAWQTEGIHSVRSRGNKWTNQPISRSRALLKMTSFTQVVQKLSSYNETQRFITFTRVHYWPLSSIKFISNLSYLTFLNSITITVSTEKHKLQSPSLWSYLQPLIISSLLWSNVLITPSSQTPLIYTIITIKRAHLSLIQNNK